jgi:uncharacterized membrane protein
LTSIPSQPFYLSPFVFSLVFSFAPSAYFAVGLWQLPKKYLYPTACWNIICAAAMRLIVGTCIDAVKVKTAYLIGVTVVLVSPYDFLKGFETNGRY